MAGHQSNDLNGTGAIASGAMLTVRDLATVYARAVGDATHCSQVLQGGYLGWLEATGSEGARIERGSEAWQAMTDATRDELDYLQQAKRHERRCKAELQAALGEDVSRYLAARITAWRDKP